MGASVNSNNFADVIYKSFLWRERRRDVPVEDGLPVGAGLEGVEAAVALRPRHVLEAARRRILGVLKAFDP